MRKKIIIIFSIIIGTLIILSLYFSFIHSRFQMSKSGVSVYVEEFGAKGDGNTNDTEAINKAIQFVYEREGGTVNFKNKKYVLKRRIKQSQEGAILLKPGVSLNGNSATLLMRDNAAFIAVKSDTGNDKFYGYFNNKDNLPCKYSTIIQNVKYGDTDIVVDNTNGFKKGDEVFLRVGNNEYDVKETKCALMAKVTAVDGNKITIDKKILASMNTLDTDINNRKICVIKKHISNVTIKNFNIVNDISHNGVSEAGIALYLAENIRIENIVGENPGAGLITAGYSSNIDINNCKVLKSIKQNNHSAKGRCFSFFNSNNITLKGNYVENFEQVVCFNESYCKDIKFYNTEINNNNENRPKNEGLFVNVQGSQCYVEDVKLEGNGDFSLFDGNATRDNRTSCKNVTVKTKTDVASIDTNNMQGKFTVYSKDVLKQFDMKNIKTYEKKIYLKDRMNWKQYFLKPGLWISFSIYASQNVKPTDLTLLSVGREGDYNNGNNYAGLIKPGHSYNQDTPYGSEHKVSSLYNLKSKINISTNDNIGTDKYIIVKIKMVPILN